MGSYKVTFHLHGHYKNCLGKSQPKTDLKYNSLLFELIRLMLQCLLKYFTRYKKKNKT